METPLGFAILIKPEFDDDGQFVRNQIQSENMGLPAEIIISMIDAWLRVVKDDYYEKIRSGMNSGNMV